MMDAGVPRETDCDRVEGWGLGMAFTVQSIPELRAFLFSQTLYFLLYATSRTHRASIKDFEGIFGSSQQSRKTHGIWIQTLSTAYKYVYARVNIKASWNRNESLYRLLPTSKRRRDELGEHDISQAPVVSTTSRTFMGSVVVVVTGKARFVCCRDKQLFIETHGDFLSSSTRRSPSSAIRSLYCVPSLRQRWVPRSKKDLSLKSSSRICPEIPRSGKLGGTAVNLGNGG